MRTFARILACLSLATLVAGAAPVRDDSERLAALVTNGAPRGLVTVVIPVPEEFSRDEEVSFEVRSSGEMEVLGRRSGLAITKGLPVRPLVLTLRVPAGADAGTVPAADVHFRSKDRELIVPVIIRVTLVRDVRVLGPRELRGLRLGDRVTLSYRVVNAGNAADTLMLDARGPLGWTLRLSRPARLVIPARSEAEVGVMVVIPSAANIGDHTLSVAVRAPGSVESLGTVHTTLGISGRAGQTAGVVLKPGIAFVSSSAGSAVATGAVLEGAVAADVFLRAQFSPASTQGGLMTQGLTSVGAFATPFSATMNGRNWDVAAGNVGLQLADLTGVNVMGQGVTGRANLKDSEMRFIAAAPAGGPGSSGSIAGAGYWRNTSYGKVGGSASHFAERRAFGSDRELTAAGIDYSTNPFSTVSVTTSLAHRAAGFTSGMGYGATIAHERDGERASFRATHAPGGTAAFARATDEFQLDLARVISERWSADFSALRSDDAGPVFSSMRVSSYSLGQRYLLNESTQLTARGIASSFEAQSAGGSMAGFGADDRSFVGGGEWRRGMLSVTLEGSLGVVSRGTERFDGSTFTSAATQRGIRAGVSRAFERWGAVDGSASMEFTGSGVGIPSQMMSASARWSGLPVDVFSRQARVTAEASYQRLGLLPASLVTRAGAVMALPAGFELTMSAERNPFFRDADGRAGWVAAMRLTAATRVFSTDALGPEGLVFEDRNLNGKRDQGEPGVPGVVVRRGESRGRTKSDGAYRLAAHARGISRIDQSSLPMGLIAHPMLASDSIERLDLPVLPTGNVVIDLELVADESGRLPQVDLEPAIVILRDATGFEWVGRRTRDGQHEFRGIPMGSYTVVFNTSRLREPLRTEARVVENLAGETTMVRVQLRSRAVRIFTPNGRGPGDAAGPVASADSTVLADSAKAESREAIATVADSAAVRRDTTATAAATATATPGKATVKPASVRTYFAPAARRQP